MQVLTGNSNLLRYAWLSCTKTNNSRTSKLAWFPCLICITLVEIDYTVNNVTNLESSLISFNHGRYERDFSAECKATYHSRQPNKAGAKDHNPLQYLLNLRATRKTLYFPNALASFKRTRNRGRCCEKYSPSWLCGAACLEIPRVRNTAWRIRYSLLEAEKIPLSFE